MVDDSFRERAVVQRVGAMPRRKQRLRRPQIRVVVGIKEMLPGEYLDLRRRPNRLLFIVVKSALNLPDSLEGDRLGLGKVRSKE